MSTKPFAYLLHDFPESLLPVGKYHQIVHVPHIVNIKLPDHLIQGLKRGICKPLRRICSNLDSVP